jgi:hypothetical protein
LQIVLVLASLKLTVVLMAFAIVLVFVGTLAQVDEGIWTVVEKYFRSAYVLVPFQLFFPRDWQVPGRFPFPGGWLIGGVMLVNMTLAYFVRYNHFTWKRTGVYVLHSGLVILMMSELFTGLYAVEGSMSIQEGSSSNVVVQNRYSEFVVASPAEDDPAHFVNETAVPASMLRKPGTFAHNEALPFDVEVTRFMKNSSVRDPRPGEDVIADKGDGRHQVAVERHEVSGTDKEQSVDTPSLYVKLTAKDGQALGTYLTSIYLDPQPVRVGDKTYQIALRFKQSYLPYRVHLIKFSFDRWQGTAMARNFESDVYVEDPEQPQEGKPVLRVIKMNSPLRYRGETLYQQDFDHKTEQATILQVVRNPAALLPYISCALVALGMSIHFGLHLTTFLARRRVA